MNEALVEVSRGGLVENIIRGHIAVVDGDKVIAYAGDPTYPTYMRSCAKPLQASAALESGALEYFHIDERELAVMCASHIGADYHVEAICSILNKIGLDESAFTLGPDLSLSKRLREERIRKGVTPRKAYNNCSGKHACMLTLCQFNKWDHSAYQAADHPVQKLIKSVVAAYAQMPEDELVIGVDGCGVPVFGLPLEHIARAYFNLTNPEVKLPPERLAAAKRITKAMTTYPEMIEGFGQFTTELMRATNGRILAKLGADAVYTCAPLNGGLGIAVKLEDGQIPMLCYAVISTLDQLGLLTAAEKETLANYASCNNQNCQNDVVGKVYPVFSLHSL